MDRELDQSNLLFRACADPTRLRLLNLLLEGEICVCHLCSLLGQPQPTVSRHLAYLRRSGLVQARRDGKWMQYSLVPQGGGLGAALIACVRNCLRDVAELKQDLARRDELIGCCAPN